ncbi:4a-hydroxytetrahydrobiopterin dehydratase [Xenophilus arseniciresistens]|uniref:Putative pterin-4-alpha-carbinolamine dehydratase n=1 Tax=Xenophilus arseniciresistens TaxID=1283306 RepID=A0AAE3N989_9BURK|nr:4a-hydroxytetrahydrobiopterin dehydratase [Xenophilus arseniciresistens]MDA7417158.1 4a-hydroxytetrahydrobiopterin dehydratase [Xenophilus arseniciresistens]
MSTSQLTIKNWKQLPARKAMGPSEIVTALSRLEGWTLSGDGAQVAIEKSFHFANYFETIAFVNALALIAHREDHHPDLSVHYNRCVVRLNTHDAGGISRSDFDCAQQIDALLKPQAP